MNNIRKDAQKFALEHPEMDSLELMAGFAEHCEKKFIQAALQCANGRWCEWGNRAESVRDILMSALELPLEERHLEPFGTTDIFGSDLDGATFIEMPPREPMSLDIQECAGKFTTGNGKPTVGYSVMVKGKSVYDFPFREQAETLVSGLKSAFQSESQFQRISRIVKSALRRGKI